MHPYYLSLLWNIHYNSYSSRKTKCVMWQRIHEFIQENHKLKNVNNLHNCLPKLGGIVSAVLHLQTWSVFVCHHLLQDGTLDAWPLTSVGVASSPYVAWLVVLQPAYKQWNDVGNNCMVTFFFFYLSNNSSYFSELYKQYKISYLWQQW